ncbi:potassium channel family protein [Dyadobacter arcticus]|uniref:Potassium channel domain-containing protein n=1 Tax=Dyadobacter arcticus TaxID=1078754 RepID=A0ABX0UHT0_9BACT|nr:potassium channel family protein [Dyadobacter arcticus]NIJ52578.1 hypothetical protein [Dyadobacter arcticus]
MREKRGWSQNQLLAIHSHYQQPDKTFQMSKIANFIRILFLGSYSVDRKLNPAFQNQVKNLNRLWRNETYKDFGIERLYRLFLTLFQFVSIGLYVRHVSGLFGLHARKMGVEVLVLSKLAFPIIVLSCNLTKQWLMPYLSAYLLIDTLIYLNYLIFCADLNTKPITYKRSLINLFYNYIEIALNFAVIYSYCNLNIQCFFNRPLTNNFEAVYYSFITTATVGFGDIYPKTTFGQFLAVSQIVLFFTFVGLFFNFYASRVETGSYFNEEVTYKKRDNKE